MVVFPALSSPRINIRTSFFPNRDWNSEEKIRPILMSPLHSSSKTNEVPLGFSYSFFVPDFQNFVRSSRLEMEGGVVLAVCWIHLGVPRSSELGITATLLLSTNQILGCRKNHHTTSFAVLHFILVRHLVILLAFGRVTLTNDSSYFVSPNSCGQNIQYPPLDLHFSLFLTNS